MMMRAVGETMILSPPLTWTRETVNEAVEHVTIALNRAQEKLSHERI
jgi:putrescine aminotransferase